MKHIINKCIHDLSDSLLHVPKYVELCVSVHKNISWNWDTQWYLSGTVSFVLTQKKAVYETLLYVFGIKLSI